MLPVLASVDSKISTGGPVGQLSVSQIAGLIISLHKLRSLDPANPGYRSGLTT